MNDKKGTMASLKSRTKRASGIRKQNIIFYCISEGTRTEPDYIQNISKIYTNIKFYMVQKSHHDPKNLLNKMKSFMRETPCQENDKFIIFLDRDEWLVDDIKRIWQWKQQDTSHRMVIFSNPCFELWLLRHYISGVGATTKDICHSQLVQQNSNLSGKSIPIDTFNREDCQTACKFSKRYSSSCWENVGFTNGHVLIDILEEGLNKLSSSAS